MLYRLAALHHTGEMGSPSLTTAPCPGAMEMLGTGCLAKSNLNVARKAKVLSCECPPSKLWLQP